MLKKIISIVLAGIVSLFSCFSVLACETDSPDSKAYTNEKTAHIYVISELEYETYNEHGIKIESDNTLFSTSINDSSILSGHTKYYFPSGHPEGFYFQKDTYVYVVLKIDRSEKIKIGLTNGNSLTVYGNNPIAVLNAYETGYGKLYINNLNDYPIVVNGTIEY